MWKKIIITLIFLLIYSLVCIVIYSKYKNTTIPQKIITVLSEKISTPHISLKEPEEHPIGSIIIKKINLAEELYEINSPKNNIEEHVTILKYSEEPNTENSTFFLAAHSGTGKIAYFEELDQLSINDLVILEYKNKTYTYKVKNIWTEQKTGTITIPNENTNQLILTTCHPTKDNYQLIINCTKI